MTKRTKIALLVCVAVALLGARAYFGASNFDRIVLGSGNYESDPYPTADIVLQNDEYITNYTDGTVGIVGNTVVTGKVTASDSMRVHGPLKITGVLKVPATVAYADSFSTTAVGDTVNVAGLSTTDIPLVSPWCPAWSTQIDTAVYTAAISGDTAVAVTRSKSYKAGATALKSGAHYVVVILRRSN